jgi:hypothetical protein
MNDNLEVEGAAEATTPDEAVASSSDQEPIQPETLEAPAGTPSDKPLLNGKFKTEEDREHSYRELERKFHEQSGRIAELTRRLEQPSSPSTKNESDPKWKQLESERNKWAQHLRRGDLSEQDKWQADEQVRLYDREIAYERAKHDIAQQSTRQSAVQTLEQDSMKVLQMYQQDLNNSTSDLFQAASQRYGQLVQAGYPDDVNTKALAVSYAAAITGATVGKAVQQDRSAMLKTLNTNVKKAVVAGAGGPATVKSSGVSSKDIERMTPAEFAKFEQTLMGV